MTQERFFVTGALGCIGAWVVRNLVREGVETTVLDFSQNHHRLELIMNESEINHVNFQTGDVSDFNVVESAMQKTQPSSIIHLAALQLPFCAADPVQGAKVNVVGTVNIFEAAKRLGVNQIVYASSTAVYGMSEEYPDETPLAHDAPLKPHSHYGVYKQANEGTAQVYWMNDKVSSIGLRPYVVYGPGRDQGMTSTPTHAMIAALAGIPYRISYGGRFCFQYVDDVAKTFIKAARTPIKGAEVFNIGGGNVDMEEIIAAIEDYQPKAKGLITYENKPLPFPENVDNSPLMKSIGSLPETPLIQGVNETMQIFQQALSERKIKPPVQ